MKKINMLKICISTLLIIIISSCSSESTDAPEKTIPVKKSISITTEKAKNEEVEIILYAIGSLVSIEQPKVSAEVKGKIIKIHVDVGDYVEKESLLAEVNNKPYLIEKKKEMAAIKKQEVLIENQRKQVKRLKSLEKKQSISIEQLDNAEADLKSLEAGKEVISMQLEDRDYDLSKTQIKAPISGKISLREISIGDYVKEGERLFEMVHLEKLRAQASFPEQEARLIKIGQEVRLKSILSQKSVTAKITALRPLIYRDSRSIEIIIDFDNSENWLPGSSVDTEILVEKRISPTIPEISVVKRSGGDMVYLVKGSQVYEQKVDVGIKINGRIEVLSGIKEGDLVAVEGAKFLSDEAFIKEVSQP